MHQSTNVLQIDEAREELMQHHNVAVFFPTPGPDEDAKYKLEYRRPAGINVVGSYALKIGARTSDTLTIDMPVTMPSVGRLLTSVPNSY